MNPCQSSKASFKPFAIGPLEGFILASHRQWRHCISCLLTRKGDSTTHNYALFQTSQNIGMQRAKKLINPRLCFRNVLLLNITTLRQKQNQGNLATQNHGSRMWTAESPKRVWLFPRTWFLWVWGNYARFRLPKMGFLFLSALFGCKGTEN